MAYHLRSISILFLLASGLALQAQPPAAGDYLEEPLQPQQVDREAWASAKKGIEYPGAPGAAGEEVQSGRNSSTEAGGGETPPQVEPAEPLFELDSAWADILLKILLFAGVAVAIAFLIRYLLGLQQAPKDKKLRKAGSSTDIDLEQIEEDLHEAELGGYIAQAEREGNYRLAMRLHYLALLKAMSVGGLIRWQKDKTNRQYLNELSGHELQPPFSRLTRIFEHYWYGDHELQAEAYQQIAPEFEQLTARLQKTAVAHAK
ncbi:MAG: DUF4129 domain-containing protein [Bacteroidetes bacterium]|nr:DUF4129 domain-containing protein [Bacteroidota bacterium]